jgi:hypothetical protein
MTAGALLLRFRQKFGKGLRTAYYRDIVRPRILQTQPVCGTTDGTAELHVMTRSQDWLDLIWGLKSFYAFSGRKYKLAVHDDGSLTKEQRELTREHFPDARLIERVEADAKMLNALQAWPRCLKFRQTNILAPKVFDFIGYLESERMIIFDSDLLFFDRPVEMLRRVESKEYKFNSLNSDCKHCYTVDPVEAGTLIGCTVPPQINSGFGLIHKDSIRFDWVEEFLALPGLLEGHFWRIEQTIIALCSSRYGVELLPSEYTLRLEAGIGGRPFRHYVGEIRHLLYAEGVRHLVSGGFFKAQRKERSQFRSGPGTQSLQSRQGKGQW